MTNTSKETWAPCTDVPDISDTLRWREPVWARPNKSRGKPDEIGEQMVTARLIALGDLAELEVIEIVRLSLIDGARDVPSKINTGDIIRRKISSLKLGQCEKQIKE